MMTNARCETVAVKASFRAAFKRRRCLVPVTAFCEPHDKKWYRFTINELPLFAFAGLWERWDRGDEPLADLSQMARSRASVTTANS